MSISISTVISDGTETRSKRHRGDREAIKLKLLIEGGNRCGTMDIIRKVIPNAGRIKSKTQAKVFD